MKTGGKNGSLPSGSGCFLYTFCKKKKRRRFAPWGKKTFLAAGGCFSSPGAASGFLISVLQPNGFKNYRIKLFPFFRFQYKMYLFQ
ncbi:MAG: hypothetical protein ACI4PC_09045 [Oscillospiraceae bacterium]